MMKTLRRGTSILGIPFQEDSRDFSDAALFSDSVESLILSVIGDSAYFFDSIQDAVISIVSDKAIFSDASGSLSVTTSSISDGLILSDRIVSVLPTNLIDVLVGADSVTDKILSSFVDSALFSDLSTTSLVLLSNITDGVVITDNILSAALSMLSDTALFNDSAFGALSLSTSIEDSGIFTESKTSSSYISTRLSDISLLTDSFSSSLSLLSNTTDTAVFSDQFIGSYQRVYVINSSTGAVSEYVLPIRVQGLSYHKGKLYIASDEGLFTLTGDTDSGESIIWEFRTGFTNMGSEYIKRISGVDVLGRVSGSVILKLVHNRDGDKSERHYKQTLLNRSSPRDGVINAGKGISSVYWQVGVSGVGPAEISELKVRALQISRRR